MTSRGLSHAVNVMDTAPTLHLNFAILAPYPTFTHIFMHIHTFLPVFSIWKCASTRYLWLIFAEILLQTFEWGARLSLGRPLISKETKVMWPRYGHVTITLDVMWPTFLPQWKWTISTKVNDLPLLHSPLCSLLHHHCHIAQLNIMP